MKALRPTWAVWGVLGLGLAVTVVLAVLARPVDVRNDDALLSLRAEQFFLALRHGIEGDIDRLDDLGGMVPNLGTSFPPRLDKDRFDGLYWLPREGMPFPAVLDSSFVLPLSLARAFAPAVSDAKEPDAVGFAETADQSRLLIALNIADPNNPGRSYGHVLASVPVARLVGHARKLSGLADEAVSVALPNSGAISGSGPLAGATTGARIIERQFVSRGASWRASIRPAGQPAPWWQGRFTALVLVAGFGWTLSAGALVMLLARNAQDKTRARDAEHEMTASLQRVESDARIAWRMLKDEHVIDGFALWDEDSRLVAFSGFLGRYLPQLAVWERPTARDVVEALVLGGHVVLPKDRTVDQAIAEMCLMRKVVPGLREMQMSDDRIYMARTVDLGEGRQVCIFNDITELRTREAERRASEALFRTAFDSGPLMMVLLDRDERPIAINRSFTATLGYTLDRVVSLGWTGILHPDDVAPIGAVTPWTPTTKRLLAADGRVLRGQVRFTPVRDADGRLEGRLLVTIEDLTLRWEAEERIRYQASLLDQVTGAVLSVDRWGRIVYANRAAQALFKWPQDVMRGTPVDTLLDGKVLSLLGSEGAEIEIEGTTWIGGRFPALVTVSRLTDDGGEPVGTLLVVTDLTQRRALDMQLMHSARLATLGEMSAGIAHEFNQCLHVIRLSSEALSMDLADGKLEISRASKRADTILSQVDRLTEMVGQMRSISRRDGLGGKTPFQLQVALDSAIRMVEALMPADGITLVRHGSFEQATALGHRIRLEQVLINLLNNARDAIADRAARQGVQGGTITVSVLAENGRALIRVRDDGAGVPDAVADQLFDPFVTTKSEERGCGLGLSISRGIAQEMGGSLDFRNLPPAEGGGAEFTLEIPLAGAEVTLPPAPPPLDLNDDDHDDDEAEDGRRVLVVDDEALSVMMVTEFLERQGCRVDTAFDGVEALALIEKRVYDVVVTDIRMPHMDGRELIARLGELQPGTPVIVVTGHLREGSEAELGGNVAVVLSKPFQLLDLRRHMYAVMSGVKTGEGV